jgi:hypothetical protein
VKIQRLKRNVGPKTLWMLMANRFGSSHSSDFHCLGLAIHRIPDTPCRQNPYIEFVVVDTATGMPYARYRPSEELGSIVSVPQDKIATPFRVETIGKFN